MRDFTEAVAFIAAIISTIVVSFLILTGVFITFPEYLSCSQFNEITKRKTEWKFPAGCFIEHHSEGMIPYSRWKMLDVNIKERK